MLLGVPSATEIYKRFTVTEKALVHTDPGEPPCWQERKPHSEELTRSNLSEPGPALLVTRVLSINYAKTFTWGMGRGKD